MARDFDNLYHFFTTVVLYNFMRCCICCDERLPNQKSITFVFYRLSHTKSSPSLMYLAKEELFVAFVCIVQMFSP